jgi:hypothetical protein
MSVSPRKAFHALTLATVAALLVELGARIVFSIVAGHSLLLYGIGSVEPEQRKGRLFPQIDRVHWHRVLAADDLEKAFVENDAGVYSKYHPGQFKQNRDEYGHLSEIQINNRGFRGRDISSDKRNGVFRVVTLGASSTFGYRNRDQETYPHYLEQYLNRALEARRQLGLQYCGEVESFEVINFGIPHLNSANIRALFIAEGLALDPDAVTFYEGANETRLFKPSWVQRSLSALGDRLLLVRFLHSLLQSQLSSFSADELARQQEGLSESFLDQLSRIAKACTENGVEFWVASQQAKSFIVSKEEIGSVSYEEEVELVNQKLLAEGRVGLKELVFLMHAQLMQDLRAWANETDVRFVDVASAIDARGGRDELISWVHLTAAGNLIVASELGEAILGAACPEAADAGDRAPDRS